jgi:nicotinamidase-related amidase
MIHSVSMATYGAQKIRDWKKILGVQREPPPPEARKSALLVVDVQEYFAGMCRPIVGTIRRAVDHCRSVDVPVVFTQHGHADPKSDGGMLASWWGDLIMENTPEHRLIPGIGVLPDDRVVAKRRYDAFFGTELENVLGDMGVEDLAIAGVMTNLCVETTARQAFVRDFRARVLMDATATATEEMHVAALEVMAFGFAHVQTVDEWIAGLEETAGKG